MMLFTSVALILAAQGADPFAKARADITPYCQSIGKGAACVKRQKSEMGYFVTMMAGLTSRNEARSCMEKGKRGRHVDWEVAASCMREKSKGRAVGR